MAAMAGAHGDEALTRSETFGDVEGRLKPRALFVRSRLLPLITTRTASNGAAEACPKP